MPSAAPSSRVASFIAEPAPARRAGTAAMIDAVIGDIVSAIPTVSGMKHTTMYAYGLCTPSCASSTKASEMLNMPNADGAVRAEPRAEPRRERRHDDHDHRDRQRAQRRVERAVAVHELEVLRDQEHHAVHREEHEDHAAGAGAEGGVLEVVHVEHRLVDVQLPRDEEPRARRWRSRTRSSVDGLVQPSLGASMRPYTSATMPMIDSTAPIGSSAASSGSRDFGTRNSPATSATDDDRDVHEEHRPEPEVAEQVAARDGSDRAGRAGDARPDRDGLRSLVRGEDVDDDRQRRRHDQRARRAHHTPARDQLTHRRRHRREPGADEEQHEPELQRALAAVAVAERARREQQAGEHERVARHDPLQLRLGRVQVARRAWGARR